MRTDFLYTRLVYLFNQFWQRIWTRLMLLLIRFRLSAKCAGGGTKQSASWYIPMWLALLLWHFNARLVAVGVGFIVFQDGWLRLWLRRFSAGWDSRLDCYSPRLACCSWRVVELKIRIWMVESCDRLARKNIAKGICKAQFAALKPVCYIWTSLR